MTAPIAMMLTSCPIAFEVRLFVLGVLVHQIWVMDRFLLGVVRLGLGRRAAKKAVDELVAIARQDKPASSLQDLLARVPKRSPEADLRHGLSLPDASSPSQVRHLARAANPYFTRVENEIELVAATLHRSAWMLLLFTAILAAGEQHALYMQLVGISGTQSMIFRQYAEFMGMAQVGLLAAMLTWLAEGILLSNLRERAIRWHMLQREVAGMNGEQFAHQAR